MIASAGIPSADRVAVSTIASPPCFPYVRPLIYPIPTIPDWFHTEVQLNG
jgi:hypothetical protein